MTTEFRDGVHADRPAAADPRPNVRLVETAADLPPGDALDLGCGDGGDALWLALRRNATGPGGRTAEVTDHLLLVHRTA
jgi:hypothetical protein